MDLEYRYKLIFSGFDRFRLIRVGMATYLDGSGPDLDGFERL